MPVRFANFRLDRIVGRSDDMIKVKGTNIYPAQEEIPRVLTASSEYRIILDNEDLRDRMIVQAEASKVPTRRA